MKGLRLFIRAMFKKCKCQDTMKLILSINYGKAIK